MAIVDASGVERIAMVTPKSGHRFIPADFPETCAARDVWGWESDSLPVPDPFPVSTSIFFGHMP